MIELIARNQSKPVRYGSLQIGPHFRLSFQRTLRIPDDGKTYPLAGDPEGGGALDLLRQAAGAQRRCRLEYLKPSDPAPESRIVHPYALVFAGGMWYVIGWSEEREGIRSFRLDRILAAAVLDGSFDRPEDFRAQDYVEDGVVFRAGDTMEAVVRYSPRVAPWFRERGEGEEQADDSVVCRYRVADPGWLVRHALWYGPEAEVLEPQVLREAVREALVRIESEGTRT